MSDDSNQAVSEEELDEFLAKGSKYDVAYLRGLSTRELQRKVLGHLRRNYPTMTNLQRQIESSMHITPEDWRSRCNVTRID